MEKSPLVYLNHILECISRINFYVDGFDEDLFVQNILVQDAVIRNFEVIGEAVKKLDADFRSKYPNIPWRNIAGMRDKLYMIILVWTFGPSGVLLKKLFQTLRSNSKKLLSI